MKNKPLTNQEIKTKGTLSIISALLILAVVVCFFLTSCGALKKEKSSKEDSSKTELTDKSQSEQSEQSQTNSDINIKKIETTTVNDKDQTTTVEETIEPVNPEKPAIYTDKDGKKQELNNSKKTTKTTVKKNNSNTNINSNTEASQKAVAKTNKKSATNNDIKIKAAAKKKEEDLHVDRKAWSLWNLSWLVLIVPIVLVFRWIWKNKAKIAAKMWRV